MMRAFAVVALCLAGCDLGARVQIAFPELGDAQSLLVAIETDDRVEVEARERDGAPVRLLISKEGAAVEVLAYEAPLDELGLSPGLVLRVPDGDRLPQPDAVFRATVERDGLSPWAPLEGISSALGDFTVTPAAARCARYRVEKQVSVRAAFGVFTSNNRAYLCSPAGLFKLSELGAEPVVIEPPGMMYRGGSTDPSGRVWLSTTDGSVWRGALGAEPVVLEHAFTSSSGDEMNWLAAAGERQVFGMSRLGVVELFDGVAPKIIYRFPRVHAFGAGLVLAGDGEVVATHLGYGSVMRYRAGFAVEELVPNAEMLTFDAIARVDGYGTVIGSGDGGYFYVSNGEEWEVLPTSGYKLRVLSIAGTQAGFLYGGEFGHLGEYRRDIGFCEGEVLHPGDISHLAFAGGLVYLLSRGTEVDGAVLTVVRLY